MGGRRPLAGINSILQTFRHQPPLPPFHSANSEYILGIGRPRFPGPWTPLPAHASGLRAKRCRLRPYPQHQVLMATALFLTSAAKARSLIDARLISTLASAPVIAAPASAWAVVKSDFILGLLMAHRLCVFSATPSGTPVASCRLASISAAPSPGSLLACL